VLHLVIGPAEHGVVRHAVAVAKACGDELLQSGSPGDCAVPGGFDLVHVPYTDRLFGSTAEASADAFDRVAQLVLASGATLSTTLHDVPSGDSALSRRRRLAYTRVVARANGLVVASNAELADAEALDDRARARCVIPLPVAAPASSRCVPTGSDVAVLGFVYPDRGYEQVIASLPASMGITALGRAADGHEDLAETLCRTALRAGRTWEMTGFLSDEALRLRLQSVAVPVAPNRRTGASASIATWLEHGRRPLVPVSAYTRELDIRWPGTLRLYDADSPTALRSAIEEARSNPALTLLEAGIRAGATEAEVADEYRAHFAACARPAVVSLGANQYVVPDNRWDLLAEHQPDSAPTVSVVIPYYNAPEQLRLVLHALTLQSHPAAKLEVIVADDGSALPPSIDAAADLSIRVVRQEDRGFRAAAARNLGAAAADGEVLLFLDADTVPEPDYVARMVNLPALSSDALVVGRRRHADLRNWKPADLTDWLCHGSSAPVELTEPQWLRDGYRWSRNLLDIDARSYRYVISAVLGLRRELFHEIGGFCEEFTSYGGEDWELAHRAYCAGALFKHVPTAVAWHDGPEWAERAIDREAVKAAETLMLQRLLPDPVARGGGQWLPYPSIVIRMNATEPGQVRSSAESAFASGTDCAIWLTGAGAASVAAQLKDPRVQSAPVPADALRRCLFLMDLTGPVDFAALPALLELAASSGELRSPQGRIRATRALSRGRRHAAAFGGSVDVALQSLFGRRDTSTLLPLLHKLG
jgi:GT2 family glycosyltransferase